ncbi:MAG: hypothetical protein JST20_03685 [Bacteroidetes bacterium]|nr:hypothetical protein [Bacteroidota bacterium]
MVCSQEERVTCLGSVYSSLTMDNFFVVRVFGSSVRAMKVSERVLCCGADWIGIRKALNNRFTEKEWQSAMH